MHDEHKDLILIAVIIFLILVSLTIIIGLNQKGDRTKVKTLISVNFKD